MGAQKYSLNPGLATFLKIEVSENGRRVVHDKIKLNKFDEKSLKRLKIPASWSRLRNDNRKRKIGVEIK